MSEWLVLIHNYNFLILKQTWDLKEQVEFILRRLFKASPTYQKVATSKRH